MIARLIHRLADAEIQTRAAALAQTQTADATRRADQMRALLELEQRQRGEADRRADAAEADSAAAREALTAWRDRAHAAEAAEADLVRTRVALAHQRDALAAHLDHWRDRAREAAADYTRLSEELNR